jgi:DNA-directed RNA polymerase subunit A'
MEIIRKKIKGLRFSLLNPDTIKKVSSAKVVSPELYDVDGYPVDGGLMDLRLGAIDPGVRCRTCGGGLKECLGHPGSIELARPIVHIKYLPIVEKFLRSTCQNCNKILISEEQLRKYTGKDRIKKARDAKKCPHCNSAQERVRLEKPYNFMVGKKRLFPTEVREILAKISDSDVKLMGINPKNFRPEWGVMSVLLVPPVTVRPSITLENGERSEDDLTHKLSDIVRANQRLWENLNAGAPEVIIEDLWDLLQYHVTTFFDNDVARIPPARHRSGQPLKTITERIKGKQGRIRKNLAGKRVNFSARTVISPDPSLNINEIGIPLDVAKILTVAESVTTLNIDMLKKLIANETYPSANYVIRPDGKKKRITADLKTEIIAELTPGYKVERHLMNGDIVLFNRHPSLHRASLMAHYVKVLPFRTFRFHPAAAFPYNADFDGDEMNIHSPQTEEAKAEARILLDVKRNLVSPKNNTNLLGCIADAVTGNFLLGGATITRDDAMQLLYRSGIKAEISKKTMSGVDVFSYILPKEIMDKGFKKIDSKLFGIEEGALIKELDKSYGKDKTMDILQSVFALGVGFLSKNGITISLKDLSVNAHVAQKVSEIFKDSEKETNEVIDDYKTGKLEQIPGRTKEESREIKILQTLNSVRTKIGKVVKEEFPEDSSVSSMINSGAGGNLLNITQTSCSVGQQSLWTKRIEIGYNHRTLPFFKKHDLSPQARGFIYSSYSKGLKPSEFFFGAITGRDSLMDLALRTPKSGYLYRRLANALQDLKVEYDYTIRDASENIVQFIYGNDGLDVSKLHLKDGRISPGEGIGIITAQSFGEPSTQMTLNVFHFAGVQEMQVTQGLPRLIEIFNARKIPSTPTMEIHLESHKNNEKDAKVLAEKIKETKLKEITSNIDINFTDKLIEVEISSSGLRDAHMTINTVVKKLEEKGFKVKSKDSKVVITADETADFKAIYKMKEKLKTIVVAGIDGVHQVLVVKRDANYVILTSGSNLREVFKVDGVSKSKTTSNNANEIADVMGIEVARNVVIKEVKMILENQGIDVDHRHVELIADTMCTSGTVKGVTRMGIIGDKSSILARASFETPIKHFVNATIAGTKDKLSSVVENIILNQPVPLGTGLPGLLVKISGSLHPDKADRKAKKKEVVSDVVAE